MHGLTPSPSGRTWNVRAQTTTRTVIQRPHGLIQTKYTEYLIGIHFSNFKCWLCEPPAFPQNIPFICEGLDLHPFLSPLLCRSNKFTNPVNQQHWARAIQGYKRLNTPQIPVKRNLPARLHITPPQSAKRENNKQQPRHPLAIDWTLQQKNQKRNQNQAPEGQLECNEKD